MFTKFIKIALVAGVALVGLPAAATPQERNLLSLEDAIAIALEKSYQMKSLRLSMTRAEENLTAARGRFKTNADARWDLPSWSESVNEIPVQDALPVFNTTSRLRYQGIFDINQPLPTDGRLTLRSLVYHRDVTTFTSDLTQDIKRKEIYTSLSLRYTQPLFTINRLKLGLKNANLNYERTSRIYRRSELDIVYNVTQLFFGLYRADRQSQIAQDDADQQQELYDLAVMKFNAGLIPEVEALQMEVDLAESRNELAVAQGNLSRTQDSFKQLIGLKLTDQVDVVTDFDYVSLTVDLDRAIQLALENRSELREAEINIEMAKIDVAEADARSEIRADIEAFYDITGVSDPFLPHNSSFGTLWDSSLDNMKRRPNNRGVVLSLTLPLWDWGVNAAEVAAAETSLRDAGLQQKEQEKTIVREVRHVVGRLKEAENRLAVLQQNQNVAQRAFDISLQRFNNGDVTGQELALDRDRLTQAKSTYLDAYIDYKLAVADLKRKTMWDFENNRSLVGGGG